MLTIGLGTEMRSEARNLSSFCFLSIFFRLKRKGRSTVKPGCKEVAEDPVVMESYNNKALERDHNVDSQM